MRMFVLADDLTGAAESGIMLHQNGFRALITLHELDDCTSGPAAEVVGQWPEAPDRRTALDSVVCASNLRIVDNRTAERVTTELIKGFSRASDSGADVPAVVLKVDSLLRGPLPGLLAGARAARPGARIVVAPALPSLGRTTRDGVQLLDGAPIGETGAWRLEPAAAPISVADAIGVALDEPTVRIADAEEQSDLDDLVRRESAAGGDVVWIGSAALVCAVATQATGRQRGHDPLEAEAIGSIPGNLLAVIGSGTPEAAAQSEHLVVHGARSFVLDATELATGPHGGHLPPPTGTDLLNALGDGDVVVRISGAALPGQVTVIADRLARLVLPAARAASLLVLSGGHTARTVLSMLGTEALIPVAEPSPGVVVSRVIRASSGQPASDRTQYVITKAGSFGEPTTLVRAAQAVRTQGATR